MIIITRTEHGIKIDGHAKHDVYGKDIICAAVSILAQNLIKSLEDLTNDEIGYRIGGGHIDIKFEDLSEQGKLLRDSFFIGVGEIVKSYGKKYVQIRHGADGR